MHRSLIPVLTGITKKIRAFLFLFKHFFNVIFFVSLMLLTSSCIYRKSLITHTNIKNYRIPLFVQLPENKFVFDNLAPLVYETMMHRFTRTGYYLVNQREDGYLFKITIKSLNPQTKFVSPDIILFHVCMKIILHCELFDFNNNLIAHKTFQGTTLISKPIDPILKSDFFYFEYKKVLERMAPAIEHHFRLILMKIFA